MCVLLKLTFEVPAETIRIETQHDAAQLSEEDLLWCFGGIVSFLDSRTKSVLLRLDACLLGFTFDFAEALHLLKHKGEVEISDREGGYLINLVNVGSCVELRSR